MRICKECQGDFFPDLELARKVNNLTAQVFCTVKCAQRSFKRLYAEQEATLTDWKRKRNREFKRAGKSIPYPEVA